MTQLVALFNTLAAFSESIRGSSELSQLYWEEFEKKSKDIPDAANATKAKEKEESPPHIAAKTSPVPTVPKVSKAAATVAATGLPLHDLGNPGSTRYCRCHVVTVLHHCCFTVVTPLPHLRRTFVTLVFTLL
jgi:hypothetical protein